jgi:hypothetical protein
LKVESGGAVRERVLEREGVIRTKRGSAGGGAEQVIAKIKPMRHAIPKQLKELELLPQKLLSSIFGVRSRCCLGRNLLLFIS